MAKKGSYLTKSSDPLCGRNFTAFRFPPVGAASSKNGVQMALQAEEAFRSLQQLGDKTILQSAAAAASGTVLVLNTNGGGSPPAGMVANTTNNHIVSPSKEVITPLCMQGSMVLHFSSRPSTIHIYFRYLGESHGKSNKSLGKSLNFP